MKKLFGGGGGGGGASGGSSKLGPQPVFGGHHPSSSSAPIPSSSQQSNDRDYRGQTINIEGMTVAIESKLAEGGFSIVFLVKHCHPRQNSGRLYALKRQFINEPALLEACRREIEITRTLSVRHPNIVTYIASSLTPVPNSDGNVFEYLLLTQYYRGSVLRLMNERLAIGQWLSTEEVLRIFTDVCAAVARLHHCQTPVIHRDLKVENLLLDEDGRCVLCDFGSATTRTLSTKTHSRTLVEDEIARFTTLSYRAPEMIDLYAGHPVTTKVDIWALGVMLYKLCYFALPFGESALGIQNASFSFPAEPSHFPPELLGLIVYMLTPEVERRPDIYQVSSIAYRLRSCQCPVKNLNNVTVPDSAFVLRLLRDHGSQKHSGGIPTISSATAERASRTPNNDTPSAQIGPITSTTSVAPRQRPKPRRGHSPTGTPTLEPSLVPSIGSAPPVAAAVATVPQHVVQRLIEQSPTMSGAIVTPTAASEPAVIVPPAMSRSATREEMTLDTQQQFEMSTRPHAASIQQQQYQQHRRNASDPSAALLDSTHLSAFKPYKSQQHVPTEASNELSTASASWNPFDLDDHSFGLSFDALPRPRKDSNASTVNVKSRESLIIDVPSSPAAGGTAGLDPFGAAPFRPRPQPPPKPANVAALLAQQKKNSLTDTTAEEATMNRAIASSLHQGSSAIAAASSLKIKKGYKKLIEDGGGVGAAEVVSAALRLPPSSAMSSRIRRRSGGGGMGADSDSVGSASDLQARMQASGSSTGEEDENITLGNSKEITVVDVKHGSLRGRHRRAHRATSSDENDGDDDDDDERRSTDDGESAAEADSDPYRGAHRFDVTDDEDLHKIKSTLIIGGGSKAASTSAQAVRGSETLLDEGGIEGSYLEQEIIGRQPLLADDDEEEQHQPVPSAQHVSSMILPGNKAVGGGGPAVAKPAQSTATETLELSVLSSCPKPPPSAGADVFRQAPFLTSQQQAYRLASSSNHQRQHYQSQQRSVVTPGATAAFVNTSFQGE